MIVWKEVGGFSCEEGWEVVYLNMIIKDWDVVGRRKVIEFREIGKMIATLRRHSVVCVNKVRVS